MQWRIVSVILALSTASCSGDDGASADGRTPGGQGGAGAGSGNVSGGGGVGGKSPSGGGSSGGGGMPTTPSNAQGFGTDSCDLTATTLPDGPKYYVDPNGDDSNPGTDSAPWKTLSKANSSLQAGDSVIVRAGTYAEVIRPENSGTSDEARIRYIAEPGQTVKLTGLSDGSPIVDIADFTTVDGFSLEQADPPTDSQFFADISIYGSQNEIKNCSVVNALPAEESKAQGTREIGIGVFAGEYNLLQGNRIENMEVGVLIFNPSYKTTVRCNSVLSSFGDGIHVESRKGVIAGDLIEQNDLGWSVRSDGVQFNGDFDLPPEEHALDTSSCGVVIRKNKIFGNAENAVDLKGTCQIVVEDNLVFGNIGDNDGETTINGDCSDTVNDRCGGMAIMKGGKTSSRDIIVRRNVVYDNAGGIYAFPGWRVYNNTIVANNRDYTGPSSSFESTYKPMFVGLHGSGVVKNNLVGNHQHAETWLEPDAEGIDGNLYFNTLESNAPFFAIGAEPWQQMSFDEWLSQVASGMEGQSFVALPLFTAVPDRPMSDDADLDFTLAAGSPAIDRAVPLAYAVGAGSGTELAVTDAAYFFGGFATVPGDRIVVGGVTARVIGVDYDSHVLTLDQSISWQESAAISLEHAGAGPDIGAFEKP